MGLVDDEQDAARTQLRDAAAQRKEGHLAVVEAIHRAIDAQLSVSEIARRLGTTRETVYRWSGKNVRSR